MVAAPRGGTAATYLQGELERLASRFTLDQLDQFRDVALKFGDRCRREGIEAAAKSGSRDLTTAQRDVADWAARCFGMAHVMDKQVRALRLLEESIEFAQSVRVPAEQGQKLIEYVYSRPAGTPRQELGGVAVTFLAAATSLQQDADQILEDEIRRVEAKSPEHFAERNQNKIDLGFDSRALTPPAEPKESKPCKEPTNGK